VAQVGKTGLVFIPSIGLDLDTVLELNCPMIGFLQRAGCATSSSARSTSCSSRATRGWKRREVTTPPLPEFDRTLAFYPREGFAVTGGRTLKTLL